MKPKIGLADVLVVLGAVLLGVGLALYDRRLALVVLGALSLCGGLAGIVRGA